MNQKKETHSVVTPEDTTQVQHLLEQFHQVADRLHSCSNQAEAEAVLADIHSLSEVSQVALLKALSKEHSTDAADIVAAMNELSPNKSIRKEARRSLIRLEEGKIYPRWQPPVAPIIQIPVAHPPRLWKGYITEAREEGEVELILCWEQGVDYNEVRMLIFILDFWERGVKEFIFENTNKRNVDMQVQKLRTQLPTITLADCTLAEGRRLVEDALAVNKWRGTTPHKEFRHHLPMINQLLLNAEGGGEDRGLTFINPRLEADEVVATFVTAWALGDYGLNYDLLSSDSSLRDGLERDAWIELRRNWVNEAHPSRFELGFIREREVGQSALWLPSSLSARSFRARKEIEMCWSLELSDTQLSGTLKEMPMGTAVYKGTGRHWFWTSYTLVQEQDQWRIQSMTDEGARAQSLSIAELQKRIKEHDDRINEILQQGVNAVDQQQTTQEIIWRIIENLHYDDALIAQLPLDRNIYGDAYNRTIGIGSLERGIVYLERLARNFTEQKGAVVRQIGISQASLGQLYFERGMNERGHHFSAMAEATLQESLTIENSVAGHVLLAELLLREAGNLDEAEAQLNQAREMATNKIEEAAIESDMGNIAAERDQLPVALRHYQRTAEIDPNSEGIWFKIGLMQRNLKQFEEARASYERAIELEPQNILAYAELSALYINEQKLPRAREVLEQGLRGNPRSAHLLALLSSVHMESGDLRRAQAVLEEAEQVNPKLELVQAVRDELNKRKKK